MPASRSLKRRSAKKQSATKSKKPHSAISKVDLASIVNDTQSAKTFNEFQKAVGGRGLSAKKRGELWETVKMARRIKGTAPIAKDKERKKLQFTLHARDFSSGIATKGVHATQLMSLEEFKKELDKLVASISADYEPTVEEPVKYEDGRWHSVLSQRTTPITESERKALAKHPKEQKPKSQYDLLMEAFKDK